MQTPFLTTQSTLTQHFVGANLRVTKTEPPNDLAHEESYLSLKSCLAHALDLFFTAPKSPINMALLSLQLLDLSPSHFILLSLALSPVIYICYTVIYNLYVSPLSKFPGPKLWACSEIFYQRAIVNGIPHQEFVRFFEQYGPVVRIAPKELIFSSTQAQRDIHVTTHVQKQLGGKKEVLSKDGRLCVVHGSLDTSRR